MFINKLGKPLCFIVAFRVPGDLVRHHIHDERVVVNLSVAGQTLKQGADKLNHRGLQI